MRLSCLRDTGCTACAARSFLVKPSDMTVMRKCLRMLDGTLRQAETAIIYLQSTIFIGNLECLCVASPICDVVLEYVPGVTDSVAGEAGDELVNAVTTRACVQGKRRNRCAHHYCKICMFRWQIWNGYKVNATI